MNQIHPEKMSAWSEKRLQDIFEHYKRKYWQGRLPAYRLVIATMSEAMGLCESRSKLITLDVERHKSDREVRSTVLHEMAHAAAFARGSRGHDPKFFGQVEKLLRLRAPIAIDTPEAGGVRILANLVPSRFPLLKRKIDQMEARRSMALERLIAERNLQARLITDDGILREFEDAAMELTWKEAVIALGLEHGLVDETGRPLTGRSRRVLDEAKCRRMPEQGGNTFSSERTTGTFKSVTEFTRTANPRRNDHSCWVHDSRHQLLGNRTNPKYNSVVYRIPFHPRIAVFFVDLDFHLSATHGLVGSSGRFVGKRIVIPGASVRESTMQ